MHIYMTRHNIRTLCRTVVCSTVGCEMFLARRGVVVQVLVVPGTPVQSAVYSEYSADCRLYTSSRALVQLPGTVL